MQLRSGARMHPYARPDWWKEGKPDFGKFSPVQAQSPDARPDSLSRYKGNDYKTINGELREPSGQRERALGWGHLSKDVRQLDSYMRKSSIDRDCIVYRGVRCSHKEAPRFLQRLQVGMVLQELGFCSTSLSAEVAARFASSSSGITAVVFRITLPAGCPAATFENGADEEREVLLRRGSYFRVTDISKHVGSLRRGVRWYIDVTWISKPPSKGANALKVLAL